MTDTNRDHVEQLQAQARAARCCDAFDPCADCQARAAEVQAVRHAARREAAAVTAARNAERREATGARASLSARLFASLSR